MTTVRALRSAAACTVALAFAVTLAISAETPTAPGSAETPPVVTTAPQTLANLQTAFAAEKNCQERYRLFALQADREGYRGVASLFRAAAKAESVHAANHVHALAWLKGEARVQLERTYAETTLANLAGSIVGEATLAQETYPGYLRAARTERQTAAMRAFNYAGAAEADHAQLMIDALGTLPTATTPTPYWVCPGCGHTVRAAITGRCPVCFTGAKKFIQVI